MPPVLVRKLTGWDSPWISSRTTIVLRPNSSASTPMLLMYDAKRMPTTLISVTSRITAPATATVWVVSGVLIPTHGPT